MKFFRSAMMLLVPFTTALGFAATPQTVGGWTIYSNITAPRNGTHTLLQASSQERYTDSDGQPVVAVIDAICSQGRIIAIAVDSTSPIARKSTNQNGDVDMTRVSFSLDGNPAHSDSWAVLDHGKTIAPYAQILQGRHTKEWAERIAQTDSISLQFNTSADAQPVTATFRIAGFKDALAAAGCSVQ